jgi:hypothetical protein
MYHNIHSTLRRFALRRHTHPEREGYSFPADRRRVATRRRRETDEKPRTFLSFLL